MGFVSVACVVILFQQTRELVPIEPPPACPQAGEKFEFAAGENRHENACFGAGTNRRSQATSRSAAGHRVIISFAFQRIACRCRGRHERPFAYIPLSLPGTSGTCPPACWNREYTSPHT